MTRHQLARGICGFVLVAGLGAANTLTAAAAAGAPASPTPTANLAALKARCNTAVQQRLGALGADAQFVTRAGSLTKADGTALQGQIGADQLGLTALDVTIQGDATLQQAHTDCAGIVTAYRVYVLEEPKIHEVIAADGVTAANGIFTGLEPQLQQLITASNAPPAHTAAAQAALNDLEAKVTAATTSISGVRASVINLLPSGYPGNAIVLKSAAANIATARGDLHGARADIDTVIGQLGTK